MKKKYVNHILNINSLTIFSSLKKDPVIRRLYSLLREVREVTYTDSCADTPCKKETHDLEGLTRFTGLYSDLISALYPTDTDLGRYVRKAVLEDDNFYIEAIASGKETDDVMHQAAKRELLYLQQLAQLTSEEIKDAILSASAGGETDSFIKNLPGWTNEPVALLKDFSDKLRDLPLTGYGIFADHTFFILSGENITPVPYPDFQPLSDLYGYERQKEQIIRNTEALLGLGATGDEKAANGNGDKTAPSHASDMLLYGDAGTGKSSTIKAIAAEYSDRGLRLIEIKKDQLMDIPDVIDAISKQPLKFILFIDDLSFTGTDDNFSALKATLEGSISGRGSNVVIYATSNRRHLVRENLSDRNGDELHVNDMLQETMSLAARFGLTVMFEKPSKDEYLMIVDELAAAGGIEIPADELHKKAEAHALRRNGRSPRTAKQLIELIGSGLIK